MSKPYVQVELDALKKAALVSSALGIQMREAVGGLVLMWAHIYGGGGDVNAFYLRTFFGVDGQQVGEALVQLGFLEPSSEYGDAWRVKGAGRYTRITEIRRAAGVAGRQKQLGKTNAESDTSGQKSGKRGFAHGLPGQTPGKSGEVEVLPGQTPGKSDAKGVLPGQKRALEPRDLSLYERERDLEHVAAVEVARQRRPSPTGGGAARSTERSEAAASEPGRRKLRHREPTPRVRDEPKPVPKYGTPEWDEAVAESKRNGWE